MSSIDSLLGMIATEAAEAIMARTETYEEAVKRTGRKWPYRTADYPCPACGEASCDLDINLLPRTRFDRRNNRFIYEHVKP